MAKHSNPKCENCKYRSRGRNNICDYPLIMKKSRGCSVEECDKHEEGERIGLSRNSKRNLAPVGRNLRY